MKNTFLNYKVFNIEETADLKILGQCQKNMLIVLSEQEAADENVLNFLRKILAAIRYDMDLDAALLAITADALFSLSEFCQKTNATSVLTFGFAPKQLGIYSNMRKYAFFQLQDTHFLFCDNLTTIESQKDLKAALWDALKGRFL